MEKKKIINFRNMVIFSLLLIVIILVLLIKIIVMENDVINKVDYIPLNVTSPNFSSGGEIPMMYTCDWEDSFPLISVSNIPSNAESLALIVDDPDAPMKTFVHLIAWNILVSWDQISINDDILWSADIWVNDMWVTDWWGPCPPKWHWEHHYHFKVYALNKVLELEWNITKSYLLDVINSQNSLVWYGELVGVYERR